MAVYSSFLFNSSSFSSQSHFNFHNLKLKNKTLILTSNSKSSSSLPIKSPFHLPSSNLKHRTVFKFQSSSSSSSSDWSTATKKTVLLTYVTTVSLAVANRVLYKLALVPMSNYPFFLAQLNTFWVGNFLLILLIYLL